jgi:hypothetical protein
MRAFAELCRRLDEVRGAGDRVEALIDYLGRTPAADAIWAVSLFTGQKPPGIVSAHRLKQWAAEACDLPPWMMDACHKVSGDLAETIALLLPPARIPDDRPLHRWIEQDLLPLRKMPLEDRRREVLRAWERMDLSGRLVWNRLITGTFRMEVPRDVVARALAQISGLPVEAVLRRLTGDWPVTAEAFAYLVACDPGEIDPAVPGPVDRCPAQWKGEAASFTADGVLLYARQGRGRQAGLYTDCTFGVWQGEALVPFARACEGLNETEIRDLDRFVRQNTVERFGPVRSVRPELVFAIAFDAIVPSSRHKSGLTVRSARITAWRRGKPAREADSLEALRALLTVS